VLLGSLLLEARGLSVLCSLRRVSFGGILVVVSSIGVSDSHYLVVDGSAIVAFDGAEGVSFVLVNESHSAEVFTELIEIVVAVKEGTAFREESSEILNGDGSLVDVADFEFAQLNGTARLFVAASLERTASFLDCFGRCCLLRSCGLTASVGGALAWSVCLPLGEVGLSLLSLRRLLLLLSNAASQSLLPLKGPAQLPLQLENLLAFARLSSGRCCRSFSRSATFDTGNECRSCQSSRCSVRSIHD